MKKTNCHNSVYWNTEYIICLQLAGCFFKIKTITSPFLQHKIIYPQMHSKQRFSTHWQKSVKSKSSLADCYKQQHQLPRSYICWACHILWFHNVFESVLCFYLAGLQWFDPAGYACGLETRKHTALTVCKDFTSWRRLSENSCMYVY